MTEIPEHLLKRSQERRAAAGGGDAGAAPAGAAAAPSTDVAKAAPAAAAVAKAAAPAKAAPAVPPPPKPDPAYVAAAKSRKKIPFWAMATLSLLPIWGFMYVQGVKPQAKEVHGPLGDGVGVYATCATCHGATGAGGVGRPFTEGKPFVSFPHIEDQLNLVYVGSKAFADAGIGSYGASANPPGYNGAFMPPQGTGLSQAQILAVVCHERYDLGGVDPADPDWAAEFDLWCAEDSEIYAGLEDGSLTFENLSEKVEGVLPVGTVARAGTPASE